MGGTTTQTSEHHPGGATHFEHLHLGECLQEQVRRVGLSPELTIDWLRRQRLTPPPESDELDQCRPYVEGAAVEVVTVHSSKGLEYPFIICPDLDTFF